MRTKRNANVLSEPTIPMPPTGEALQDHWSRYETAVDLNRPNSLDYINRIVEEWQEFHGDRVQNDDPALVAGFGKFRGHLVAVMGHQKGHHAHESAQRNWGMVRPSGYRKAMLLMEKAEEMGAPVISLIDTPGAEASSLADQEGQAGTIAFTMREMLRLRVPTVAIVISEGGSGGAI